MVISAKEMLQEARAGSYAVAQININNLEWTKSVLTVAEDFVLRLFWAAPRARASI